MLLAHALPNVLIFLSFFILVSREKCDACFDFVIYIGADGNALTMSVVKYKIPLVQVLDKNNNARYIFLFSV